MGTSVISANLAIATRVPLWEGIVVEVVKAGFRVNAMYTPEEKKSGAFRYTGNVDSLGRSACTSPAMVCNLI